MSSPKTAYRERIETGALEADPAQEPAVDALERLHDELVAAEQHAGTLKGRFDRLLGRPRPAVRGVYLWGGVGRGKTLLMDLLYHCLPFGQKRRQHFHRFMATVHSGLRRLSDEQNPLDLVADQIASETRIICFDEFFVSDIADAMILGNLFTALFERGVTLAATSNIPPDDLYRDGLQRQRFLPAIEAIKQHTEIVELEGNRDYRLRVLERADVYQTPADAAADEHLAEYFAAIAPDEAERNGKIEILGRDIAFERMSDGVIWLKFDAICDGPRSQDDYIEFARTFQNVLVSEVPRLTVELENQARRFIALVDEFYDRRVKLILSADAPLDELYAGQKLEMEFERTRSRLLEMQSHDYLAAAHKP
ncbi:MAG: cell division protein ZapE [Gammaproteobacteria bacterium]|nr:cell division protein ZapE [Gammaproteobacteria bacterium]